MLAQQGLLCTEPSIQPQKLIPKWPKKVHASISMEKKREKNV